MIKIAGIIPARYQSTRFPGKPLADINGKSMIRRVYEQCIASKSLDIVCVATDDQRIYDHVTSFDGKVMMTSEKHQSGTERCYEAAVELQKQGLQSEIIINIQGDEPFIEPAQIDLLCTAFLNPDVKIATLIKNIENKEDLFNENVVKVVRAYSGKALYFSRHSIPFLRDKHDKKQTDSCVFFKHIGIYGYKTNILKQLQHLAPSILEKAEALEQLKWLENGYAIHTLITNLENIGIDTPDDLKKLI